MDDIDGRAQQAATVRPTRALALVAVSRGALVVLVAVAAWVVQLALGATSTSEALAVSRATVVVAADGTDLAGFVERLVDAVASSGARVVELDLGAHTSRRAPVRLRLELMGRSAGEVDRLVRQVASVGIDDLVPQGVTPVAGGVVIDLEGTVLLRATVRQHDSASAPESAPEEPRPALVVLNEVVDRAGVDLRRLEMRGEAVPVVRLDASGRIDALVVLLGTVEREHSAPLGLRSVLLRSDPGLRWDLDLTFGLGAGRPAAAGGPA